MSLKNIIITGSIGSYPTSSYGQKEYVSSTDEQSFPLEKVSGSSGGSVPNLNGQTSSIDLFVNIDQKWSGYNDTPSGLVQYTHSSQDEFINGEFSGSSQIVTSQRIIDEDCIEFLKVSTELVNYKTYFYVNSVIPLSNFMNSNTSPNQGEIYLLYDSSSISNPYTEYTPISVEDLDM
jgi:hypothetical protein